LWYQFYWRRKPGYQRKSQTCSYTLIHFTESSRYRHDRKSNSQLIRGRNCLPFASTCVHSLFFAGSMMFIVLVFCVTLCFVCLRHVSSVHSIARVPSGFSNVYLVVIDTDGTIAIRCISNDNPSLLSVLLALTISLKIQTIQMWWCI
jgi:hypothetical protein